MTFNVEVIGCYWDDGKGQWLVKLRESKPGQEPREFEDYCDLLLHCTGILNVCLLHKSGMMKMLTPSKNFKWPSIPGLKDRFKGRVTHTARWPKDYQAEQWKNDRVAVIGSGVGGKT